MACRSLRVKFSRTRVFTTCQDGGQYSSLSECLNVLSPSVGRRSGRSCPAGRGPSTRTAGVVGNLYTSLISLFRCIIHGAFWSQDPLAFFLNKQVACILSAEFFQPSVTPLQLLPLTSIQLLPDASVCLRIRQLHVCVCVCVISYYQHI
jgi:hypothetical protein